MSEFEAAEISAEYLGLVGGYMANYATHLTIYLTLLFAYCAAMYVAGNKLDTLQVFIATVLFVVAAEFQVLTMAAWVNSAQAIIAELANLVPAFDPPRLLEVRQIFGLVIWNVGIVAALVFTWRVRRRNIA